MGQTGADFCYGLVQFVDFHAILCNLEVTEVKKKLNLTKLVFPCLTHLQSLPLAVSGPIFTAASSSFLEVGRYSDCSLALTCQLNSEVSLLRMWQALNYVIGMAQFEELHQEITKTCPSWSAIQAANYVMTMYHHYFHQ